MWELYLKEGWVPKKWCFWIVVWRRCLRIPCTARRSNQSILKEINPEHSLEGLMLKLQLQYFSYLMRRADSLEKSSIPFFCQVLKGRLGFPGGMVVKNSPVSAGDTGFIPGLGQSPGEGNGNPSQYPGLNPMDRGGWWATAHTVAKSQMWLKQLSMHACT